MPIPLSDLVQKVQQRKRVASKQEKVHAIANTARVYAINIALGMLYSIATADLGRAALIILLGDNAYHSVDSLVRLRAAFCRKSAKPDSFSKYLAYYAHLTDNPKEAQLLTALLKANGLLERGRNRKVCKQVSNNDIHDMRFELDFFDRNPVFKPLRYLCETPTEQVYTTLLRKPPAKISAFVEEHAEDIKDMLNQVYAEQQNQGDV